MLSHCHLEGTWEAAVGLGAWRHESLGAVAYEVLTLDQTLGFDSG